VVATKAEEILFVQRIRDIIADKGLLIGEFLAEGDRGADVKKLQQFLADRGYLKQSRVSGTFGSDTASALVAYQVSAGIIQKASDKGSGFAGPATLAQIRHDIERETFLLVRAEGWAVL
jgi:peptidoglycan hydrolase-like protein with peptidoglycan-binding domain